MTQGRQQQIVQHFRDQLMAHEATSLSTLDAAHKHTLATIQPHLDKLYRDLAIQLDAGETIPPSWIHERLKLEHIVLLITRQVDGYGAQALQQTRTMQHVGVTLGMQSSQELLNSTVPRGVNWTFGIPSQKAINDLIGATQSGSPLSDLFNGYGKEAADGVSQALITGLTLGRNPRDVARDVQAALGISRNRALVIARTTMLNAYRDAALETYKANSDVCEGWVWVAALDKRTCAACIMMNGTEHSLDEDLNGHPCCRCAKSPKTKSWDAILGPLGIDTSNIPDTRPSYQSGSDWFESQDANTQQQVLGSKVAYDLYQSGDASLDDFVGVNHDKDWGSSVYQKSVKVLTR